MSEQRTEEARPYRPLRHRDGTPIPPSTGTHYTSLIDLDYGPGGGLVYPPEQVVQVCVVNDVTCLNICKYEEGARKTSTETVAEATVSTSALLAALVAQLDPDVADAALRMRSTIRPGDPNE